jgi:integrase
MLTDDDIYALIAVCQNNRDRALIACLFDSGARKGELLSCTIADAKFDNYGCELWLRESKTKTRPACLIFSSAYLRAWLADHPKKDDPKAPIFCSLRAPFNVISRTGLFDNLRKQQKEQE